MVYVKEKSQPPDCEATGAAASFEIGVSSIQISNVSEKRVIPPAELVISSKTWILIVTVSFVSGRTLVDQALRHHPRTMCRFDDFDCEFDEYGIVADTLAAEGQITGAGDVT